MRFSAYAFIALLLAGPAAAQGLSGTGVEGNWGCRALIDGTKAGLLTIYSGSYGYASANFASAASGSGSAEMASNGVTFLDGPLVSGAGITTAILGFDANGQDVLQLYTADKNVLSCTPR